MSRLLLIHNATDAYDEPQGCRAHVSAGRISCAIAAKTVGKRDGAALKNLDCSADRPGRWAVSNDYVDYDLALEGHGEAHGRNPWRAGRGSLLGCLSIRRCTLPERAPSTVPIQTRCRYSAQHARRVPRTTGWSALLTSCSISTNVVAIFAISSPGFELWLIKTLTEFNVTGEIRRDRVRVWVKRSQRGRQVEDKIAASPRLSR